MAEEKPTKPRAWSPSDRAELDEILEERRFQERLAKHLEEQAGHRKRKIESVRGWASLFTTVAMAIALAWDKVTALWKAFLAWAAGA